MKRPKITTAILFFIFISIKCTIFLYGETTYKWDFGDGTPHSFEQNPKHTYACPGRYEWTLTVTVDGVTCQKNGITTIQPDPNSPISYKWDFGDGTPHSFEQNPKHTYACPGRYEWTLTVTIDGVTCEKKGITTIQPDPNSPISYKWDFGDGTQSTEPNPKHVYQTPGEYTWTLWTTADGKTCKHLGVITISPGTFTLPNDPDFNDDGKVDILWRNNATGENMVWYMDGTDRIDIENLETKANLKWKIVGTGDFNGDGKVDILWRNFTNGKNRVWFMDGITKTGAKGLEMKDMKWRIVGTGDFNGDGKVDILWRHFTKGKNRVWFMDGINKIDAKGLEMKKGESWRIVGTGDFNGDGKVDILWRNFTNGKNRVWFMDGITKTGAKGLEMKTDMRWEIVGTGDFNGDKKVDILWRNYTNGKNRVWFMDGITKTGAKGLEILPDTNWKILDSGD